MFLNKYFWERHRTDTFFSGFNGLILFVALSDLNFKYSELMKMMTSLLTETFVPSSTAILYSQPDAHCGSIQTPERMNILFKSPDLIQAFTVFTVFSFLNALLFLETNEAKTKKISGFSSFPKLFEVLTLAWAWDLSDRFQSEYKQNSENICNKNIYFF